jgi:DNA-binding NtrC family response regulator
VEELIGKSKSIQQIRRKIKQLAKTNKNVIILGERGVGKSMVAKCIHHQSAHSVRPFVYLDVTTIQELKLRSIVQAISTKREFVNLEISDHGRVSLPGGTSLIIDKAEQTSIPAQTIIADFLRQLSQKPQGIRVMLLLGTVSSSFKDILKGWEKVTIPPLRDRREDVPDLIDYFVRRAAQDLGLGEVTIDINAVSLLARKEWKGNVEQLKNFIGQAFMLSENKETFTLPESLIDEQSQLADMLQHIDDGIEFAVDRSLELIERRILERVLKKFGFNQSKAARFLRITEDTLRYRMKKLGIQTIHS